MYTLDTNIIIYYLKNDPGVVPALKNFLNQNTPLYVSAMTEIELFGFQNLQPAEIEHIERILHTTSLIPIDSRIARMAGALRGNYGLKIADSTIAATALFTGSPLITRNVRDFKRVLGLRVIRM